MTTEIELKYQLLTSESSDDTIVADISAMLNKQNISFEVGQSNLVNDYFDSDNLALRKMDFGLRIRTKNGKYEQTIKTAGKVENGLHQRPEYNVDIATAQLSLSLFPQDIWPENTNVMALEKSLNVIFSTNFSRHTWLITQGENIIELALDRGKIQASPTSPSVVINEIEIELVKGNEQALFLLADNLKAIIAMEPSNLSKAARGYALYYDEIKC